MTLLVKGSTFVPAPTGLSAAVCIDVVDLGTQETQFGARSRVKIVWALSKTMKDGRPFIVGRIYGRSLHPKAQLRQDLESWSGRKLSAKQISSGIDLERLIGRGAYLSIQHDERDGTTYANVTAIVPLPDDQQAPPIPKDYVRVKDRDNGSGGRYENGGDSDGPPPPDDTDEIPF